MKTKRLFFLIVPLLMTPVLWAQSSDADDDRAKLLSQRREKLEKKWQDQFRAADTDDSRSLTPEEARKAGLPATILDHFADIDTDHDGQLTPEELMAAYEKRLDAQKPASSE